MTIEKNSLQKPAVVDKIQSISWN